MELLDLEQTPGSGETLRLFLQRICDQLGFDHAAYAGSNPISGTAHGGVTYPEGWKQHYAASGFYEIDPTLRTASRSIAPVDWRVLERDESFAHVFRNARDFGISERGITIPVRGPYGDVGMLSVTRDCSTTEWNKLTAATIGELQSMTVHIHDIVMQSDQLSKILRQPNLSSREREILQWIAAGKTQQDVGDILGISHRTVEVHLRSAREKLYALTTPQAVARAIGMRLIYAG